MKDFINTVRSIRISTWAVAVLIVVTSLLFGTGIYGQIRQHGANAVDYSTHH